MKSVDELKGERLALLDEAKVLGEMAQAGDDLTEEQAGRFAELTDDGGLIAMKDSEIAKAEAFRSRLEAIEKQRAAALQSAAPSWSGAGPAKAEKKQDDGRIFLAGQRSKYFDDPRDAKAAAEWFAASIAPDAETRRAHLANAARFGGEVYAAQSIGTDGKGGYLLPTPLATEIIKNRDAVAVAPQLCRQFAMTTETYAFNVETGDTTVYYPGESTTITPSDITWSRKTLTAVKRTGLVKLSRESAADANVSVVDEIVDNLSYAFARKLDLEFIRGDGSGTYGGETGLIGAVTDARDVDADSGETSTALLDLEDYVEVKKLLPHKYQEGAAWLMSPDCWYQVEQLLMAAGGAATAEFSAGLSGLRTFMGKPVYLSDLFPADAASAYVAFYGNFRRAVAMGDRNDMSIVTSAERYFDDDDLAVRATHRYDLLVYNPEAYVGLQLAGS